MDLKQNELHVPRLNSGELIDNRFEIIKCLGYGGMGVVYLCRNKLLHDTSIAVKLLWPHLVSDTTARERLKREALLGYSINHINIVRVYDYFSNEKHSGIS